MKFPFFHGKREFFFTFFRKSMFSHPRGRLPRMLFKPMKYYTFWEVLGAMGSLFEKSALSLNFLQNVEKVKNHGILHFSMKSGIS